MNLVVKTGWILERLARELVERIPGVTMNSTGYPPRAPSRECLSYFLPMKDVRHMAGVSGVVVGFFTHGAEHQDHNVGDDVGDEALRPRAHCFCGANKILHRYKPIHCQSVVVDRSLGMLDVAIDVMGDLEPGSLPEAGLGEWAQTLESLATRLQRVARRFRRFEAETVSKEEQRTA